MKKSNNPTVQRQTRIRAKLLARVDRPRLTVSRSNANIFAQIIGLDGKVLAAYGSQGMKNFKGNKTAMSTEVGTKLGELAKKNNVTEVVFDRGSYKFHGRVKALAEAVRSAGIKF